MQSIGQETGSDLFEVILYFEGNSWSFSTFAEASLMQEALERAEKEFFIHSLQHQLGTRTFKVASAYVIRASDGRSLAKHNGKWQLAH